MLRILNYQNVKFGGKLYLNLNGHRTLKAKAVILTTRFHNQAASFNFSGIDKKSFERNWVLKYYQDFTRHQSTQENSKTEF